MSATTETTTTDAPNPRGAALIDAAFGELRDDFLTPDELAPPAQDGAPPATTDEASSAAGRAPADAAAEETEPGDDDAAPTEAPAKVTLTEEELARRIEAETKRARADQAKANAELAQMRKELKRAQLERDARGYALQKLQADGGQRYLTAADAMEERLRVETFVANTLAAEEQGVAEAERATANLASEKEAVAAAHYKDALLALVEDGAPLGYDRAAVHALLNELAASDEDARDFLEEYQRAATTADADKAARRMYRALVKAGKATLQARTLAEIKDEEPAKPRPQRTQTHGTSGNVGADRYRALPIGERGRRRLDDAFAAFASTAE